MSSGCGGTLLLDRGSFTSPGYPGNHPVAKQCRWLIRSPARRRIAIDFTDFLIADVDSCEHNFVSVYDGDSSSAPLVGTYCGNVRPAHFTSHHRTLLVVYSSDENNMGTGFRLVFSSS
ncbi:Cubilin [Lamellibrachia satsuma]|nr:Cubilin [Lamellibrachia satsuma]